MKLTHFAFQTALLGVLLFLLSTQNSRGAGVTIIAHGSSGLNRDYPSWVDDMSGAIAARAGSAAVYNLDVGYLPDGSFGAYFNYESGTPPSATSTNAEIVIKVFWYKVAAVSDAVTATDVASVVTPFFGQFNLAPTNGGPVVARPLAELPIHLIGHSRGSAVVSEIARLLAAHGVWVDQMTTLDPHPQTPADCILLVCPGAYDSPVNVYDNVLFADNYYQIDNTGLFPISGEHIDGTAEEQLTQQFDLDGINDAGNFSDHIEVHDWYYGTIDLASPTASGDPLPRSIWYPFVYPYTYARGFQLSRISGGQWLREHQEFQLGFANSGWKFDTNALRNSNYTISGTQWPNVFLDNTNGSLTVQAGQSISLQVRYRNAFSSGFITMDLGTDVDQNPYNNTSANIFLTTTNSATGNVNWVGSRSWTPTLQDDGKFVYSKITDSNGLVRYYYLRQPFQVLPAPNNPPNTPVNLAPANGALNQSLTPTLRANAFSDPDGDTHAFSRWIIRRQSDGVTVFDSLNDTLNKTSIMVPTGMLTNVTSYSWSVSYTDSRGAQSSSSAATTFTTQPLPHNPILLAPQLLADGRFTAILSGETGRSYVIESSSNFVNWTQVYTNTLTSPTAPFADTSAPIFTRRFYRAVAQ